jgi:hypothetical protein
VCRCLPQGRRLAAPARRGAWGVETRPSWLTAPRAPFSNRLTWSFCVLGCLVEKVTYQAKILGSLVCSCCACSPV